MHGWNIIKYFKPSNLNRRINSSKQSMQNVEIKL